MTNAQDIRFMRMALGLARRGLGRVAPNPAVGCVLTQTRPDGSVAVVGRGWTQAGGRPHAETEAIARAGDEAKGATAYVSLEPCAHHGATPPCAEALIKAGVARVVGAFTDPDPRVSGKGFALLREAGIDVTEGVLADEAAEINAGFTMRTCHGRPLVNLKLAGTLDGKTATKTGQSQWITGTEARNRGHLMRAMSDAIMVGSATAIVDDPDLTCRLPGMGDRSPVRIVADGRLRLPLTAKLVRSAREVPVWILTLPGVPADRRRAFADCGVELIEIESGKTGMMDMKVALQEIGRRGITRLLVEGGARLASSLILAKLVDRIDWFQAPKIIGGDGHSAVAGLGIDKVDQALHLERYDFVSLGEDILHSYRVVH